MNFSFKIDIYGVVARIYYNVSYNDVVDIIKKNHDMDFERQSEEDEEQNADAGATFLTSGYLYIWFDNVDKKTIMDDEFLSTVNHESGHAAFKILKRVDVPVKEGDNEEAFLYLQELIFKRIIQFFKKRLLK